jgi:CBS domain-containing protein
LHKQFLFIKAILFMDVESTLRQRKIRHLDLAPLVCVEADANLHDVVAAMRSQQVGCVLVMERHKLAGIFTERDLMIKVIGSPVEYSRAVREFMTPHPTTLHPDDSVADAIQLMDGGGHRDVPLVDEQGRLLGRLEVSNIIDFLSESFPQEVLSLPPRPNQNFTEPDGA